MVGTFSTPNPYPEVLAGASPKPHAPPAPTTGGSDDAGTPGLMRLERL
jgi:hypothetical protein